MARKSRIRRQTGETLVSVSVDVDGRGKASASTGVGFIDHLLCALGKHAMMDVSVRAESKDGITHHLVEDVAIAAGSAIDKALGDRKGVRRFGHASVPMDESLAEATVDLVRRPYHRASLSLKRQRTEGVEREDLEHFFQSLLQNMSCCVHLDVVRGANDHHKAEAAVKALAVALRGAAERDPRQKGAPSTKGVM